jgi:hypothetical protein
MKPRIYVVRENYLAWMRGELLSFSNGVGVVGDHVDHPLADAELDAGRTVGTTRGTVPYSTLRIKGDTLQERLDGERKWTVIARLAKLAKLEDEHE